MGDVTVIRALLVSDSAEVARLLEVRLRSAGTALQLDVAATPATARDQLATDRRPELVLIDLNSHGFDGLGALTELSGVYPDIPVLALDDQPDHERTLDVLNHGAQDCLDVGNTSAAAFARALERSRERHSLLRRKTADLERAQAVAHIGSWHLDVVRDVLTWTPETYRMFGVAAGTPMTYAQFLEKVHPNDRAMVDERWKAALAGEPYDVEHRVIVEGEVRWVRERAELEYGADGALLAGVGTVQEISDLKRREAELVASQAHAEQASRVLQAIRGVNRLIARESDRGRLIRRACELLVQERGFLATWIILAGADGLVDLAQAGLGDEVVAELRELYERESPPPCFGRGGTGAFVVEADACETCPVAPMATGECALVAPLRYGGRDFGVLAARASDAVAGEPAELQLLQGFADDLAFALAGLEDREAGRRTQRLLGETERLAHVGGWVWDPASGEVTVSDEWRRIFGWTKVDLTRDDVFGMTHPNDLASMVRTLEDAMSKGGPFKVEHRIIRPDTGEVRHIRVHGELVTHPAGRTLMFGATYDVTDERVATERLRFQARMLASVGEAIAVTDSGGRIAFWNRAAEELYGWTAGEVLGRPIVDFTPLPELKAPAAGFKERMARGEKWSGELRLRRKDGSWFDAFLSDTPVLDDNGNLEAVIGVSTDISARKRAEEALREASLRLDAAVRAGRVGFFDRDMTTNRVRYSAEWKRQIGYAEDEIGDDFEEWRSRVHPDDLEPTIRRLGAYLASDDPEYESEFRFRHRDGSYRQILAHASAVRDEEGRPIRLLGSHVDITELRHAEEQHLAAEVQLQRAQRMESIGRLAGGVAHDFNNILQAMTGHLELLRACASNAEAPQAVADLNGCVERAAALTRQLLAFARRQAVNPVVLDLNEAVAGMLKMLGRLIGENIELVWKPGPVLWPVQMDAGQVDQVLVNLVVNARDAINGPGSVVIATRNVTFDGTSARPLAGDYVELSVRDSGSGMDEATRRMIFEPFFSTKAAGEGTGLGLATVYGIVEQNRGRVEVVSEPGSGSTFGVYFPRAHEDVQPAAEALEIAAAPEGETILLVEDDPQILQTLGWLLQRMGYTVATASTPHEALQIVDERPGEINLLLSDVVMPEMNGPELWRRVNEARPGIKCLLMSGYTADMVGRQGPLPAGVQMLQKPFSTETLALRLREVLEREPPVGDEA